MVGNTGDIDDDWGDGTDGDNGSDSSSSVFQPSSSVPVWGSGADVFRNSLRSWGSSYGSRSSRGSGHGITKASHEVGYLTDKKHPLDLDKLASSTSLHSLKTVAYDPSGFLSDPQSAAQLKEINASLTKAGKKVFARVAVSPDSFEKDIPGLTEKYFKLGFDGITVKNSADFPPEKLEKLLQVSFDAAVAQGKAPGDVALHLEPSDEASLKAYVEILEKKTVAATDTTPEQKGNEALLEAVKKGAVVVDGAHEFKDPKLLDRLVALGVRVIDNEPFTLGYSDADKFAKEHRGVELIREQDPNAPANERAVAYNTGAAADWLVNHDGAPPYGQCRQYVLDAMKYGGQSGMADMLRGAAATTGANAVYEVLESDKKIPGLEKTRFQDLFITVAEGHGETPTKDGQIKAGDTTWWEGAENGHATMAIRDADSITEKGVQKFDRPEGVYGSWTGLKDPESHGRYKTVRPAAWNQLKPEVQEDLKAHPEVMAKLGFNPDAALVASNDISKFTGGAFSGKGSLGDDSTRQVHFADLQSAWDRHSSGPKPDVTMDGTKLSWAEAAERIKAEPDMHKKLELANNAINASIHYGGSYDRTRNLPDGHWISTPYDAAHLTSEYEHAICGDIAAAKLFLLRDAGVASDQMALVTIAPGSGYSEYHVVPAVQFKQADGSTTEAVMELNRRGGGPGYVTLTTETGTDRFGTLDRSVTKVVPLMGTAVAANDTHFYYAPIAIFDLANMAKGPIDRSRIAAELAQNPDLIYTAAWMVQGETGGINVNNPAELSKQLVQLESAMNRALIRDHSLEQALWSIGESSRGYYARGTYREGARPNEEQMAVFKKYLLGPALAGSDESTKVLGFPATGNASANIAYNGIWDWRHEYGNPNGAVGMGPQDARYGIAPADRDKAERFQETYAMHKLDYQLLTAHPERLYAPVAAQAKPTAPQPVADTTKPAETKQVGVASSAIVPLTANKPPLNELKAANSDKPAEDESKPADDKKTADKKPDEKKDSTSGNKTADNDKAKAAAAAPSPT